MLPFVVSKRCWQTARRISQIVLPRNLFILYDTNTNPLKIILVLELERLATFSKVSISMQCHSANVLREVIIFEVLLQL